MRDAIQEFLKDEPKEVVEVLINFFLDGCKQGESTVEYIDAGCLG